MQKYGSDRIWPLAEGGGSTIAIVTGVWLTAVIFWFSTNTLIAGISLVLFTGLWLLVLYFFRDPKRDVTDQPGQVIGPGDGEIVEIVQEVESTYLQQECIRISMFLNITDVHVQRVPLGGKVTLVQHQPGKFLQAFRPEASDVNEHIAMITQSSYGVILIKQIAGILARRCVNYAKPGDMVITGQRYGLIRFSSRLDLYLPTDAKILIKIGDKVYGGLTPIAQLQSGD